MAGHSKWTQIKRQKSVTDAIKSRVFSRFARLITLESKKTGGSLSSPSLSSVITRAKAANMPKENIERAIAKGISKDSAALDEILYEAYGPGGAAILASALTDNRNRTTQEIKHLLSENGVELASPGAALWAFSKNENGHVPNEPFVSISEENEDRLRSILEALDEHDDIQQIFTNVSGYESSE